MQKISSKGRFKKLLGLLLALALAIGLLPAGLPAAQAKTLESDSVSFLFFYVRNSDGANVLAHIVSFDELMELAHGYTASTTEYSDTELLDKPYSLSFTDNLPAVCYGEGMGLTLPELVEYISENTTVPELKGNLHYAGADTMGFEATDSINNYVRNYTYTYLYDLERFYFPRMYDAEFGWTTDEYETANGGPDSFFYDDSDEENPIYYSEAKNWVFEDRIETPVYLGVESNARRVKVGDGSWARSGDSANDAGDVEDYYDIFGDMTGFYSNESYNDTSRLDRVESLRLSFPITEQELRTGKRSASENFKWIYKTLLNMTESGRPDIIASAVPAPTYTTEISDGKLIITVNAEAGATVYHSFAYDSEGSSTEFKVTDAANAAQFVYTGPIEIDIEGKTAEDLAAAPVYFSLRAVKIGSSDAGQISSQYPIVAPPVTPASNVVIGSDVTLSKSAVAVDALWDSWSAEITNISVAPPSTVGNVYTDLTEGEDYSINPDRTITINGDVFVQHGFRGANRVLITSNGYQDRAVTQNLLGIAPEITSAKEYKIGSVMPFTFDDPYFISSSNGYQSVSISIDGGAASVSTAHMIRSTYGSFSINTGHFTANGGASPLNVPGTHTLNIVNNNYYPTAQTVTVNMVTEFTPEPEPPELAFAASAGTEQTVGEPFAVSLGLNSDKDFDLYGAQIAMKLSDSEFTIGTVTPAAGWEYGVSNSDGFNYVTFTFLDENGTAANTENAVAAVELTPKAEGTATISFENQKVTGETADYLDVAAPSDITVTVSPAVVIPSDPTKWDGSIDISWYNSTDTEFTLTTAAQFAGFAAITNNKPANSEAGVVTGLDSSMPADDFLGKTVILATDVDLGGIELSPGSLNGTSYIRPEWEGLTWTPIASYTDQGSSVSGARGRPFKGTFDGGFHTVNNVYIPNPTLGNDTPAANSHALFGEIGHDAVVKNIIIESGYIRGGRYAAGVVGRNWGHVENCGNYATIETDGDRGGGGITGLNWENTPSNGHTPWVKNCFNAGLIMKGDQRYSGGISGDNEGLIENCYNVGTGRQKFSPYALMGGMIDGARSTGTIINCYSITGDGFPDRIIGNSAAIPATCAMLAADDMKTADFVALLNAGVSNFLLDTEGVNGGFPILNPNPAPIIPEASDECDVTDVSAIGAEIDGTNITASVANTVASKEIDVTVSAGAEWKLYSDAACENEIPATMNLVVGANTAYIKVTAEDGVTVQVYTLVITRAAPIAGPMFYGVNAIIGQSVTIGAQDSVTDEAWAAWAPNITEIALGVSGVFTVLDESEYTIGDKSITIDGGKFPTLKGTTCTIRITADGYNLVNAYAGMRGAAPEIITQPEYVIGEDIVLTFDDQYYVSLSDGYNASSASIAGVPGGINASYTDRFTQNSFTIRASYFTGVTPNPLGTPGTYTLYITNANYYPNQQSVTINMVTELTQDKSDECDVTDASALGAAIDGTNITADVANTVTSKEIDVTVSTGASWKLYSDAACENEIPATMDLVVGANTAYIKVTAEDGVAAKVYTLVITREAAPVITPDGFSVKLKLKDNEPVNTDDTFTVEIYGYSSENTEFTSFEMVISYDEAIFSVEGSENTEGFATFYGQVGADGGKYNVVGLNSFDPLPIGSDGVKLGEITFKVNADTSEDSSVIKIDEASFGTRDSMTIGNIDADVTDSGVEVFFQNYTIDFGTLITDGIVSDVTGVTGDRINKGEDVTFKVTVDEIYTPTVMYSVSGGTAVVITEAGGVYTIPSSAIKGNVKVTVTTLVNGDISFIENDIFNGAPTGHKVMLLKNNTLPSGNVFKYDGKDMFWSPEYDAYVCFVPNAEDVDGAREKLTTEAGTLISISYSGDVNGSGRVQTSDADLVAYIYSNLGTPAITDLMRFEADVNGNGTVDTDDVLAILKTILAK